jgi:hypothetical protein
MRAATRLIPIKQGPAAVSDAEWRALVPRALARAGISQKAAASDLGITQSQLSRQLTSPNGEHLSFWRMASLPDAFWHELWLLMSEQRGLSVGLTEQDRRDLELGRAIRESVERRLA